MIRFNIMLAFVVLLSAGATAFSQSAQQGPYTLHEITDNVFRIEDANESNPPGEVVGDDGQLISMNNCSDMYLIAGREKILLIDLSNEINWDPAPAESLHSLIYRIAGYRSLYITVTHNHGDHLGMLPAFEEDPRVTFWVPENEFEDTDLFPDDRSVYFAENSSLDLGGSVVVNTMEVPGHTPHSTIFFLKGQNLVFTGDAIGSGSGIWLFNEKSFYTYKHSIDLLIRYIEDPDNQVNRDKVRIFGGHFWQGTDPGGLTARYIYDMRTLIGEMRKGSARMEEMSTFISFLDTNFSYGTATITWNRESAIRFASSETGD